MSTSAEMNEKGTLFGVLIDMILDLGKNVVNEGLISMEDGVFVIS